MTEVILSTENLTVLGGPSRINLDLEVGPQGQRGTFIFPGTVNPNSPEAAVFFTSAPQVFDLYVISDPGSSDYLQLYQYINQDGQLVWVESLSLRIDSYSTTRPVLFTNGLGEVEIDLSDLGLAGIEQTLQSQQAGVEFFTQPGSAAYINAQISISNFNVFSVLVPTAQLPLDLYPVSFTYIIKDLELDTEDNKIKIPFVFTAIEFTENGPVPVNDKALFVQMAITLQDPQFIIEFLLEQTAGGEES